MFDELLEVKTKYSSGKLHSFRFDSGYEALEYSKKRNAKNKFSQSRTVESGYSWAGTKTFEEAVNLAEFGWVDGLKRLTGFNVKLEDQLRSIIEKYQINYDVIGNDFDVGMYNEGIPEHWSSIERNYAEAEGKSLKICANISVSASVSSETITGRSAALVMLCNLIETIGMTTQIDCLLYSSGRNSIKILTRLKNSGQPIELAGLAFFLMHPASLRRIMFGIMENSDTFMSTESHGYGYPTDIPEEEQKEYDVYLPALLSSQDWNEKRTFDFVKNVLSKQGVKLEK